MKTSESLRENTNLKRFKNHGKMKIIDKWTILMTLLFCGALVAGVSHRHGSSRITLEPDGGYSGIVVKITDEVNEDDCSEILNNFKSLVSDGSSVLSEAFEGQVFFKDVTIVVPNSWRDEKCKTQIQPPRGTSTFGAPDIYIDSGHPLHRGSPYAQQSRGCASVGDFIAIPANFLKSWNGTVAAWGNPAKVFIAEWSKFRYGIFDEFGYQGDPIYPHYFKVGGNIYPTGTSNIQIEGNWLTTSNETCSPEVNEDCLFYPLTGPDFNQAVTCSLGYLPFLPSVKKFCSSEDVWYQREALAPTKHNVLCQGRSAQEVIANHEDFLGGRILRRRRQENPEFTFAALERDFDLPNFHPSNVDFNVVREPRVKYVLVIESSSSMIEQNLWKWVSKAAQKFIRYDLQDHVQLAIVTFSSESRIQHNLAILSDERSRARLADTIPNKYQVQGSSSDRCIICGIETAIQSVLRGHEEGAHIILITRGDNASLDLAQQNTILEYVRNLQIKFSSILLPQGAQSALTFFDSLSQLSSGLTRMLPVPPYNNGNITVSTDLYSKMMDTFNEIRSLDTLYPSDIGITVHSKTSTRIDDVQGTSGTFVIDKTLGRETQFSVVVEESDNYFIKSVTFTDSHGETYGPYTSMTNDYNIINIKTINFPHETQPPPFNDPAHLGTVWKYVVQWYPGGNMNLENVIRVESKPRNLGSFGLIDISMWTNSDSITDIVTNQNPLIMYVSVTRGSSPIIMARVRVTVTVSLVNGTALSLDPIELYDKGNGDPDLTSGDGIYSRYLSTYPSVGRYTFVVQVDDNEGRAFTVQEGRGGRAMSVSPSQPGLPSCCGSEIQVPQDLRFPTGTFERTVTNGPVVHLIEVPSSDDGDRMPPARIADLQLHPDPQQQKLVAEWTAPGDDYDHGKVTSYNFIFSEDISDLLDPARQPPILHSLSRPDEAGFKGTYSFTFKHYDKDYHVGLYAIDEAGNRANISNIVTVRISEPDSTEGPNGGGTEAPVGPEETDWVVIGVVTGVVVILLILILLGLYVYFCLSKRRRRVPPKPVAKSSGVNVDLQHKASMDSVTDNGSYDEGKNSSSNQLVPKISTISNAYRVSNGSSFADGLTPTYWSASQLLKEHEERKLREKILAKNYGNEFANNNYNGEQSNIAYDYTNEAVNHYGYLQQSPMVDTYPAQLDPYFGYNPQRLSTADSSGYPVGYEGYGGPYGGVVEYPDPDEEVMRHAMAAQQNQPTRSATSIPRNSGSDQSSSGVVNQSTHGSLLSVNSGRASKTRNITQV